MMNDLAFRIWITIIIIIIIIVIIFYFSYIFLVSKQGTMVSEFHFISHKLADDCF